MIGSTFVWLSVDRSFRPLQMDKTCKDRLGDKGRSSHETNSKNKLKICVIMYDKLYDNVVLPSL